jgi:O-antigen biosynthesis rhamnosyltransferase
MRILHFYKTYLPDSPGGVQSVIYHLAEGSARRGHIVDVLFLGERASDPAMFDSHTIHRSKLDIEIASTGFSLSAFSRFSALASVADIVHYHFPWPFMDVVHFSARALKPTLVTYHSDIVRQRALLKLYNPLMRRFLGSVDSIVATSPNYLGSSDVLRGFKNKVSVIPIGIEGKSYPEATPEIMARWGAQFGDRFFLFIGVLRYYKGLHILLDALSAKSYPVVIVGSGPAERELRAHAERLKLSNVHFLGMISEEDKVALLRLCYAIVFPSHLRSEAFGVTLLEGAMFGKPMISSEIGTGTSYINIDNETGLVVPPSDPEAFAKAMGYLLDHPNEAKRMGENAQARYKSLFTADIMVSRYLELYERLLTGSS